MLTSLASFLFRSQRGLWLAGLFLLPAFFTPSQGGDALFPVGPVANVWGKVRDSETGTPLSAQIQYQILPNGRIGGMARSRAEGEGLYKASLPGGYAYRIVALAAGYQPASTQLDLRTLKEDAERRVDLYLERGTMSSGLMDGPDAGTRLGVVYFEGDALKVKPENETELLALKTLLEQNPSMRLSIQAHSDSGTTLAQDLRLSKARARYVRAYFIAEGISSTRLSAIGYGNTHPAGPELVTDSTFTVERVEFHWLK